MTAKKLYFTLIITICLLIVGAGAMMYFGYSFMKKSSDTLVTAKLDNVAAEEQEVNYLQAKKDLEKYKSLGDLLSYILPKDKDQARAVRELYKIGEETNISVDSIQFPASSLGQKAAATTNATTPTTNTTPATPTTTVTQAKSVEGMTGVLGIDVDITLKPESGNSIPYDNMIKFLQKLELNRRSMQIKKITVKPDAKNGGVTFNVTLTIFIKP